MQRAAKTFGKRNAAPITVPARAMRVSAAPVAALPYPVIPPAEDVGTETVDTGRVVVPRSFRAALLAGLITGCSLAGLNLGHGPALDTALKPLLGLDGVSDMMASLGLSHSAENAVPYLIALSLFGGARLAATTILIAHRVLGWMEQTSYAAYAGASAAVSVAYTALFMLIGDAPPAHGWAVEITAGVGAGLLYRMFAGARPSSAARRAGSEPHSW